MHAMSEMLGRLPDTDARNDVVGWRHETSGGAPAPGGLRAAAGAVDVHQRRRGRHVLHDARARPLPPGPSDVPAGCCRRRLPVGSSGPLAQEQAGGDLQRACDAGEIIHACHLPSELDAVQLAVVEPGGRGQRALRDVQVTAALADAISDGHARRVPLFGTRVKTQSQPVGRRRCLRFHS